MSRFEESQFPDLQERLESLERSNYHLQHAVSDLRRTNEEIKEIRVVELAFKDKMQNGVVIINHLLEDGFEIRKEWQTDAGIVCQCARWGIKDEN